MFDLFTARSSLLPYAFVWAPYIWMGKLLRISNDFSSEASEPISYGASLMWGNKRLLKLSRSVDQDGRHDHIWLKPLKNFYPELRMPWGWIFAQINGDGRSTKVAKRIVLCWCLTFLRQGQVRFPMHLYEPHTFEWENCWEFQKTSPLKALSQFCSNFICSHLWVGKQEIAKIVTVRWPRWQPYPYMVKTFKNLLFQNRECLGAESLHKSSGTRGLPKLIKELSYVDIWPFYGKVKFASLCICMSPIHLNRKIVENFKGLLLGSQWAKFAQIFCSPEQEVLMVSYCGQSVSVVGRALSVVRRQQLL